MRRKRDGIVGSIDLKKTYGLRKPNFRNLCSFREPPIKPFHRSIQPLLRRVSSPFCSISESVRTLCSHSSFVVATCFLYFCVCRNRKFSDFFSLTHTYLELPGKTLCPDRSPERTKRYSLLKALSLHQFRPAALCLGNKRPL